MEIRTATLDDLFAIMTLMRADANDTNPAWPKLMSSINTSSTIRAIESLTRGGTVFVAVEGADIVGVLAANLSANSLTAQNIFNCVFVTKNHRTELFAVAVAEAEKRQVPMAVCVQDEAEAAAELYLLGFECAARVFVLDKSQNEVVRAQ